MPTTRTILTRLKHLLLEGSYIPREYYVFDDRQLVYLPIYKVASTSIKTALLRSDDSDLEYPHYMHIHQTGSFGRHSLLSPRQRRYFKFAFVRDPFDRLISCYEDRVRRPLYEPIGRYYFDSHYNYVLLRHLFGSCFSPQMTFPAFLALVAQIPDWLADGHFKSQHAWLYRFGQRIPDYVGKLETITDDWKPIAERFELPALGHQNPSLQDDRLRYFSSPELVEMAARRYMKDILFFDYEVSYQMLRRLATGPATER